MTRDGGERFRYARAVSVGALWLEMSDGSRLPIKPAGVLIGRSARCDVVLADGSASRTQAVIFDSLDGPTLTVLGKGATAVNGEVIERDCQLRLGDRITMPGLTMTVTITSGIATPPSTTWVVRGPARNLFGVTRSPFLIGTSRTADLRLASGPEELLRFHLADRLHVEAIAPLTIRGVPVAPGEIEPAAPGAAIVAGEARFEVVAGGTVEASTLGEGSGAVGASAVRLEFLARGGRLTVTRLGRTASLYLPERRCDLIAALLQPAPPLAPGDDVPDDLLLPRVWPARDMTRVDLNVLLHRARHDLVGAGLDGGALLRRAEGGNATRFVLVRGARVEVV